MASITTSESACSTELVASIFLRVWVFSSGWSVIQRNVASGAGACSSSPATSSSMARVSITVLPEPVGDDRLTACRSPALASRAAARMFLTSLTTPSS